MTHKQYYYHRVSEIKSIVAEAANFAQESPEPSEAELFTDITIN